ncbi:MAG: PIN domain-containing protein [Gammaproteobacteria bacterium]|nr:PIN domain-containing protein [Gammaproteobacteria bacterium]MYK44856.1 PIN domain-containing protein [Gammaproteobacteria bacterium]
MSTSSDQPTAYGLADTGALLAMLDRDDRWHDQCVAAFGKLRLPLATTAAVLTELFHLLDHPAEVVEAWRLVRTGALTVRPITDEDLPDLERLMGRYADRPMDFADATLVHVAEKDQLSTVFTIDHDDFETYRIGHRGRFRIEPARG